MVICKYVQYVLRYVHIYFHIVSMSSHKTHVGLVLTTYRVPEGWSSQHVETNVDRPMASKTPPKKKNRIPTLYRPHPTSIQPQPLSSSEVEHPSSSICRRGGRGPRRGAARGSPRGAIAPVDKQAQFYSDLNVRGQEHFMHPLN